MTVGAIKKFLKMDALIMKNNKLPLKERYNNFIQKHPKFWLTLIYGVLMLTLAITMFIVALDPPDNKTASADFRQAGTCPDSQYNKDFYFVASPLHHRYPSSSSPCVCV